MARYRAEKTIQLNDGPGNTRIIKGGEEFTARPGLKGKHITCLDEPAKQVKVPKAAKPQVDAPPADAGSADSLA